jgi:hypothetical protein
LVETLLGEHLVWITEYLNYIKDKDICVQVWAVQSVETVKDFLVGFL